MIDLKKYPLILLFKLFPLGKELGYNSQQLRLDSTHHNKLFQALHYAIKKVIKDFGGQKYRENNAQEREIKRGPKPKNHYLD